MRAELHMHSEKSDGRIKLSIVEKVCVKKGISVACITDHDRITVVKGKKVLFVRSVEVSTDVGHVLVYGAVDGVEKKKNVVELLDVCRDNDCVAAAAHPFDISRSGVASVKCLNLFNFVELLNLRHRAPFLQPLLLLLKNKVFLAGSDAHSYGEIGVFSIRLDYPVESEDDFISCLKRQDFSIEVFKCSSF